MAQSKYWLYKAYDSDLKQVTGVIKSNSSFPEMVLHVRQKYRLQVCQARTISKEAYQRQLAKLGLSRTRKLVLICLAISVGLILGAILWYQYR